MFKKTIFLFVVMAIINSAGFAEEKIRIAVMDLEAKNVSNVTASIVTDFLRNDLYSSKKFILVERSQMEKILNEQKFQMTGCTSTECAVEIGKILNASQMVVGSLSLLGKDFYVTIRVVDVETAETKFSDSDSCNDESELKNVTNALIARLTGKEIEKKVFKEAVKEAPVIQQEKTQFDVAWRSAILPGWGQIDNNQGLKGWLLLGTEVAAIGGAIATSSMYGQAVKDYNSAEAGADFNSLASNAQNLNNLNKICFWTAIGVWAYGVIDPYVFGINKDKRITLDYNNDKIQLAYSVKF